MDKNGLLNGQWTMDNGQWTMDNGQWTEIMSRLSGLIPTSSIRPICRRKQQTRSQIRVPSHPSEQQPLKDFVLLSLDFFFFGKDFQRTDAQITGFEGLSHF
jgi:hypothetical protein